MAVVMDAYDIQATIAEKLFTGEYVRIGSVVRHAVGENKGQIVKHLTPVNLPEPKEAEGIIKKIYMVPQNNKKITIAGLVLSGLAIGGTAVYWKAKRNDKILVKNFKMAFKDYIESVRCGTLNLETIETLSSEIALLGNSKNYSKYEIELSAEDLTVLIAAIRDFTMELAENNNYEIVEDECGYNDSSVIDIQRYLDIQRQLFQMA